MKLLGSEGEFTGIKFKLASGITSYDLNHNDTYIIGNLCKQKLLSIKSGFGHYEITDRNGKVLCKRTLDVIKLNFQEGKYYKVNEN